MSRRGELPKEELARALEGLKPFQARTVARVVQRMFDDPEPQRRFLVADEVGLGKTKVAKSLVVEMIQRLWDDPDTDRIDIIYICSNHQIARQNVRDLAVLEGMKENPVDRITMLPAALSDLSRKSVNLVAFTPNTSLNFGHAGGRVGERAMLFHLLEQIWPNLMARQGAIRLFQLGAPKSFRGELRSVREHVVVPAKVTQKFGKVLRASKLDKELQHFTDGRVRFESHELHSFVGRLRRALARACIELLTPDLIILDEFQRFTKILDGEGPDGELARELFNQSGARILLLSATPYKMLSQAEDEESHFKGFERTVGFLLGPERSAERAVLRQGLTEMRRGILGHRDPERLAEARDKVQDLLQSVMVRTERLAASGNRSGMLRDERAAMCRVAPEDVQSFVGVDRVVRTLADVPGMVEYWKSAPYLFNFMDEYKVRKEISKRIDQDDGEIRAGLNGSHMLDWRRLEQFKPVEPMNGRLRWLLDDLDSHSAFDLLWLPPSLPQTELAGAYADAAGFTKRLVFSGWTVVPRVVAALTSYERERRHHRRGQSRDKVRQFSGRLVVPTDSERFAHLALLMPCAALANYGDPLRAAEELGVSLPIPPKQVRARAMRLLRDDLQQYLDRAPKSGITSNRWYAAAQLLLEPDLAQLEPADFYGEDRDSTGLDMHWRTLMDMLETPVEAWGRPPDDLIGVLADIAVGGPGPSFLRPLERIDQLGRSTLDDLSPQQGAARLAWAFRSVINSSEADQLIMRGAAKGADFWRMLLKHCMSGGLGSVLDEWLHLVPDQLRLNNTKEPLRKVVEACASVLRLEDSTLVAHTFGVESGEQEAHALRTNFAMRFGQARGSTAEGDNPTNVRNAFNSPFHPFVLISTSVGQEGLDFHHYAHAIVHWNIPSNPVDLEQREGRVHRYKNHAVRKNVAADFHQAPELVKSSDPWATLFDLAKAKEDDLKPWWIYPGDAAIERLVPMLPLSREVGRLKELIEATSLYRMTMGQPRQSELIEVLAGLSPEEQELIRQAIQIDLTPRGAG
ncbi:hypothetical protein DDE18_05325 [Nocardioides gansuensis]|uniref:Helicase C-terminal domain-containing protein n=1 Tax=Nocardioides gansuensis TaxID=2138300 RepID=A0A2T8FDG7_9ACTN|nr:helicase-related protein [Nocardioides gansuensis]PVG83739.1 hypothetical protein DDE18_05325 [Nocardioides gansuensis]